MPRRPRVCPANTCFHVLNRAVARLPLFEKREDYKAFERVLRETWERESLPIYAYCVMPNHWHFVVCPETKNQLTDFFRWLTHTHTMRWHAHHQTQGTGHLYQGRFKTFPIEDDEHLLAVLRYVERIRCVLSFVSERKIGSTEVRGLDNTAMRSKGNFYPNGRFLGPGLGKLT